MEVSGTSLSEVDGFGREADPGGGASHGPQVSPYQRVVRLEIACSDSRAPPDPALSNPAPPNPTLPNPTLPNPMSAAHWHLVLNHIPLLGLLFGPAMSAYGP